MLITTAIVNGEPITPALIGRAASFHKILASRDGSFILQKLEQIANDCYPAIRGGATAKNLQGSVSESLPEMGQNSI